MVLPDTTLCEGCGAEFTSPDRYNNGVDEFVFIGILNSSNSPQFVNLTPLPNKFNTIKIKGSLD